MSEMDSYFLVSDFKSCPHGEYGFCFYCSARPTVVCLCGSTKFKQQFIETNFRETMVGNIVLTVGWFGHADGAVYSLTEEEKIRLDELHKRKIDLADEVLVIDVGGYIGQSTISEIVYAYEHGKLIRYAEPLSESSMDKLKDAVAGRWMIVDTA